MRKLKEKEKKLVQKLLSLTEEYSFNIEDKLVEEMDDGKMGSLYFVCENTPKEKRKMGKEISKLEFKDSDDILVSVSLNIDNADRLFELDIWKVDFSQLKSYPSF